MLKELLGLLTGRPDAATERLARANEEAERLAQRHREQNRDKELRRAIGSMTGKRSGARAADAHDVNLTESGEISIEGFQLSAEEQARLDSFKADRNIDPKSLISTTPVASRDFGRTAATDDEVAIQLNYGMVNLDPDGKIIATQEDFATEVVKPEELKSDDAALTAALAKIGAKPRPPSGGHGIG